MTTLSILIGNSDDKLKQSEWSEYVQSVQSIIEHFGFKVHFYGFSHGDAPWQNACWVIELDRDYVAFVGHLRVAAWAYHQDSIAIISGMTRFIKPEEGNDHGISPSVPVT